jgi:hypothetical protein
MISLLGSQAAFLFRGRPGDQNCRGLGVAADCQICSCNLLFYNNVWTSLYDSVRRLLLLKITLQRPIQGYYTEVILRVRRA